MFVSRTFALYERAEGFCYAARKPANPCRPALTCFTCDIFSKSPSRKIGILKAHLICSLFPHHILRFQVKGMQRVERAKEIGTDLWKAKNYFPLLSAGKSWIINYPPSWSWREHHCSLLSLSFTFHDSPIIISQTSLISTFPFLYFHFKHFSMSEVCFGRLSFTRPHQTSQRTNYMIFRTLPHSLLISAISNLQELSKISFQLLETYIAVFGPVFDVSFPPFDCFPFDRQLKRLKRRPKYFIFWWTLPKVRPWPDFKKLEMFLPKKWQEYMIIFYWTFLSTFLSWKDLR